jgi:hypothetical protein
MAYLKIKWIITLRIYLSSYPSYSDLFMDAEIRYPSGIKGYLNMTFCYFNGVSDITVF